MNKSKIVFFMIVIMVVIALAVWAGILIAGMRPAGTNPDAPSPYSAVYLSTGDIYFGRLSWFPSPHMTDVWFIERSQNQNGQSQVGVVPMKSVFWGPVDEVNFNARDIVFSTRLRNGSQIVWALENPTAVGQQSGGGGAASSTILSLPSGVPATSTK
jgi:hypothetical protein